VVDLCSPSLQHNTHMWGRYRERGGGISVVDLWGRWPSFPVAVSSPVFRE